MRFISVRELRNNSGQVWRDLPAEQELIVTSNGKPVALLSAVDGDHLEESLAALRRAKAMVAMDAMQQHALRSGLDRLTLEEINTVIQEVRKERPE